ncbi:UNVERIFIED_CONTAM: Trimethyltridecatetraene synthase [Sesamum latifolium]|uniref:Trimethyltridecatetraene synthase n=1 Tax=Sesamum latifolium TaxID=2727402 RepID=A0AAW2XRX6_9LAMI
MEISSSALLLALLCLAVVAAFLSKIRTQPKRKRPPGPNPWPIIGNLNLLGPIPHQSLHFLSQKYGQIMQLKFGKFPVVVASSPDMAKQFLRVHDTVFASRPPLAAGKYISYNYSDMTWAPYGPYWRQTRKIYLTEMFNAKKLESFEHIRVEEGRNFLSRLRSLSGKPVVLKDHLSRLSLSIVSRMVFGKKYYTTEFEDEKAILKLDELPRMLDEWFFFGGVFHIGDWIPWLSCVDLQGYVKRMKALSKKLDKFYDYVLDGHLTRKAAQKDFIPEDVLDALLQLAEDPDLEVKLTRNHVKALAQEPQGAKEELDRVIGRNRWVEEKDYSQLPYIDAVIMESMRLHPLATLLAPRYAMDDCEVAGYDIAKGTTVLINAWSIGKDPTHGIRLWSSCRRGRRRCPGYSLGLKVVRTTLANLLHEFELKLVDGMRPEDINIKEKYDLTTHPKEPLSIVMEPTLPDHLY